MAIISQNAIKPGFFVTSGRNSGEIDEKFDYFMQNEANFKCPQTHQRSGKKKGCQELFLGLSGRKGYNVVYGKSQFSLRFGES